MKRMKNCLKAAFELLRMLPGKVMLLVFLQVATSGAVFVFADVIEPVLYSVLFDGLQNSEWSGFLVSCALGALILLVMLAIQYLNDVILDANLFHAINELSIRSFDRYHRLPFYRTGGLEDGDVFNRIQSGSDQAVSVWVSMMMAAANCLSAVILLGVCAGISWPFAAIAVGLSLTAILRVRIRMKQSDAYSRKKEAVMGQLENDRYSVVHDMEFAVVSGMEEHILTTYRKQREVYWKEKKRDVQRESLVSMVAETFDHLFRSIAPFALLAGRGAGFLTYGMATSAFSVLDSLRESIPYLSELLSKVAKAFAPIERLQELLGRDADRSEDGSSMDSRKPAVCVKNLSISFGGRRILRDLSLDIPYGQKVALIGKNGSGKSTLLRSIMGYTKPDTGCVTVSGKQVHLESHDAKRAVFSYAPASAQLFSDSLVDNIAMGADEPERTNVIAAADKARISQDMLDAGGDTLSGGQAMRVNLARAFIHAAPILILDEPTSSVEAGQGKEIIREALCGNRTVLVTTHDPAYLSRFDRLILLEDGKKVCDGSYEDVRKTREYQEWLGFINHLKGCAGDKIF